MPAIAPEGVLKELAALWAGLAATARDSGGDAGVLRACAMTFIAALEPADDTGEVAEHVARLMHEHPSRAILLRPSAKGTPLEAHVTAECWRPFGKQQQVCCERIDINAPLESADEAARLILGLLAPDLPVILWCRGPSWLDAPGFDDFVPRVTEIIVDSRRGCGFKGVAHLRGRARHLADLDWTRTTRTRQAIARAFDDPANAARVNAINAIVTPPGERYLAAWLLRCLPGRRLSMDGPPGLLRLEGPETAFEFPIAAAPDSDYLLLNEELETIGADPVFDAVLPVAESLP